jgi:hypothetical protein
LARFGLAKSDSYGQNKSDVRELASLFDLELFYSYRAFPIGVLVNIFRKKLTRLFGGFLEKL